MSRSKGVRDLQVWNKATDLVVLVYQESRSFPADERYGLTSQMRRASVSVVANIAEGTGRATRGEFANCLSVARGSLIEVEALVEVATRLAFLDTQTALGLAERIHEVSRMLTGLRRSITKR